MYFCSEAVKFLPDIDKIISFETYAGSAAPSEGVTPVGAGLSDETVYSYYYFVDDSLRSELPKIWIKSSTP